MTDYDIYFPVEVQIRDGKPVKANIDWDGMPWSSDENNAWKVDPKRKSRWAKVWPEPEDTAFNYLAELLEKGAT